MGWTHESQKYVIAKHNYVCRNPVLVTKPKRTVCIGEIERRWILKETWTAGWFMAYVYLHIAPPFVLIRVMQLLVYTNTSCLYKRIEPRYIRLTKIVIFEDTLCILTQKLAVILF